MNSVNVQDVEQIDFKKFLRKRIKNLHRIKARDNCLIVKFIKSLVFFNHQILKEKKISLTICLR